LSHSPGHRRHLWGTHGQKHQGLHVREQQNGTYQFCGQHITGPKGAIGFPWVKSLPWDQPTMFTILPGTTITFLGSRPCSCSRVLSCSRTAFSICTLSISMGNSRVNRVLPLFLHWILIFPFYILVKL